MQNGFGFPNENIFNILLHKNLRQINLGSSKITSQMIQNISKSCHSLTTLVLTNGDCLFTTNGLKLILNTFA